MVGNFDLESVICHICQIQTWEEARRYGLYKAESLEYEGFIHCSSPEQILQVANTYYSGVNDLVILWIDPLALTAELRWELSEGSVFPHIYGPLNLSAVIGVIDFTPDDDGVFRNMAFPDI
jgi:uncharacterized protein (DUF952 family)